LVRKGLFASVNTKAECPLPGAFTKGTEDDKTIDMRMDAIVAAAHAECVQPQPQA
jgi:hypothetical protein